MKLDSILATTDLTEASDDVLRAAAGVAALTGAKLHVLHAFDFQTLPYTERNLERASFGGRIEEAKRVLDEQVKRAVPGGVEVGSQEVVIYVAHKAIVEQAERVDADLVVLGPHRRRALGDAFLGSTADRVIRTVGAPCLIVRGPLSLPLRRVVVPVDLSEPALGALEVALAWSGDLGRAAPERTEVVVVHAIPRMFEAPDFAFDREVIAPELHREVDAVAGRADPQRKVEVREEIRWGDSPADEVLEAADAEGADLLVLATHGQGAVARALIGSVASTVARRATCPVLLVPPDRWNTERR